MNSKLEKLAQCVRRPKSLSEEWVEPDASRKNVKHLEMEDRKTGLFPYDDDNLVGLKDFYTGKDILITGGTGFLGKVLIEKILRSTPEGGRIFLMLRGRKGLSAHQRVQAMLDLPIFKLVMTENPEAADRLVIVEGDCSSIGLGLSQADRQALIDNVSIVFHCAATVRFDLNTSHMIIVNTRGTREMVYLCRGFKKLKAFIHVSTAFCNATKDTTTPIPEHIIRQEVDWKMAIKVAEKAERDGQSTVEKVALDLILEKIASKHTNNYTFTKALAEDLVDDESKDLPTVIVRPTVVIASYEDPFGGWVDNLYGPMSIWDGIGQGIIRAHYGIEKTSLDYVPVDLTVKTMITAAWHRGIGFRFSTEPGKLDVINSGTNDVARSTCQKLHEKMQILYDRSSHRYIFRYPRVTITNHFWLFWFITMTSHIPLGILVDTALMLIGRKPMLMSIYRRIYFAQTKLLHFFSSREFNFDLKNQWVMQARMPKKDRGRFSAETDIYLMAYYHDNIEGIIKYVFKEKSYTAEQSNRNIMYYLDWIHTVLLVTLCLWVFSWIFPWQNTTA